MLVQRSCTNTFGRGAAAIVLALSIMVVADARPSFETMPRPSQFRTAISLHAYYQLPVIPDKDKKDPDMKEPTKPPEVKWPTDINGKDIAAVMKDMEDPDPVIREFAVQTLPLFGPPAQKGNVSKLLIKRMRDEKDPGVRIAVFGTVAQIQFESKEDNVTALQILANSIEGSAPSSLVRVKAIQAIALFGPKGESAVGRLTGIVLSDPSYEVRRSIAATLGRVGFGETTGPNMTALTKLADLLAKDVSAAVRMEAMQSLLLLGPPWAAVKKADDKLPPPIDAKAAGAIIRFLRARIGDPSAKPPIPAIEKDKQVEIWARLVLMRFDPREINDENLDAIAKYLSGDEVGVKAQALSALGIVGELASKKLNDVVRVMESKTEPLQLTISSIQTLIAMGAGAKPAVPNMKKLLEEYKKPLAEKTAEVQKLEAAKKPIEPQLAGEKMALEEMVKLLEAAIKHIEEAKPVSPGGMSDPEPKKG